MVVLGRMIPAGISSSSQLLSHKRTQEKEPPIRYVKVAVTAHLQSLLYNLCEVHTPSLAHSLSADSIMTGAETAAASPNRTTLFSIQKLFVQNKEIMLSQWDFTPFSSLRFNKSYLRQLDWAESHSQEMYQWQMCRWLLGSFPQQVSELRISSTPLRNGWTRVSVPKPGRVSVIAAPAPEKHHSPQGPVAHFKQGAQNAPPCSTFLLQCPWRRKDGPSSLRQLIVRNMHQHFNASTLTLPAA